MSTLIATVTADCSLDQLAAFLEHALRAGGHRFGEAPKAGPIPGAGDPPSGVDIGSLTVTRLELRHPDGEHYRWTSGPHSGEFASAADETAHPDEVAHEAGDRRGRGTDLGDDPDGDVAGYDGAGAQ